MKPELYPMTFVPVYKDHLWGGRQLAARYGRKPPVEPVAESWEVAALPEGMSLVAGGPLAGRTLEQLVTDYGSALLGEPLSKFPLLIKIIDAHKRLSLQVHPGSTTAAACGGDPKTEMWYILAAEPGAQVMTGLKVGVDRERFVQAVRDNEAETVVNLVPVQAGDAIFIPGGRVHAIDAGCLLLEVQQASDTTFRVCDWGRFGSDGKPRKLHLDQALAVIDWRDTATGLLPSRPTGENAGADRYQICASSYFIVDGLALSGNSVEQLTDGRFNVLFCVWGTVTLTAGGHELQLAPGTSCLVPAAVSTYTLNAETDSAELIVIARP